MDKVRKDLEKKKVLLCLSSGDHLKTVKEALSLEGYQGYPSSSVDDFNERLRFDSFGAIIVEDSFGKEATAYLETLPMILRREIIYLIIGEGVETGDHLPAYTKSADLVVNTKDIGLVAELLNQTVKDHQEFYRTFKNVSKEIGKQ